MGAKVKLVLERIDMAMMVEDSSMKNLTDDHDDCNVDYNDEDGSDVDYSDEGGSEPQVYLPTLSPALGRRAPRTNSPLPT